MRIEKDASHSKWKQATVSEGEWRSTTSPSVFQGKSDPRRTARGRQSPGKAVGCSADVCRKWFSLDLIANSPPPNSDDALHWLQQTVGFCIG